jgi:trigger factor
LEITLDKHSVNQASIKIKLSEADYQTKVEAKLKDYAKKASIKGFRPGKAPMSMVKSMHGTSVLVEEINNILGESLNNYLKEQPFKILGNPLPVASQQDKVEWKTQKEFDFEYKIGFIEGIQLLFDNIKATNYSITVDQKLIDETLENLVSQYGNSTNPDVSESTDTIYGDLMCEASGFRKSVSLDLDKITEKLRAKFTGIGKNVVVEFEDEDIKKDQLEEIFGLDSEEIDQISGVLAFEVTNITRAEKAEMNQEFFDKVFGQDLVSTKEEFIAKVKETLQSNYNHESKAFSVEEIKKELITNANIELPEAFLKEWLLESNKGKVTAEEVEKEFPQYAKQLTWSLISNHVATENKIQAAHEEVLEKTKQMVREQFASSGLGAQMEGSMDMFVDNYLKGEEGQNYMSMLTSVQNDKVLSFVEKQIELIEKEVSIDEFKELLTK